MIELVANEIHDRMTKLNSLVMIAKKLSHPIMYFICNQFYRMTREKKLAIKGGAYQKL